MRISTNEFLLGSMNDLLQQQQNVNTLNRQLATGETMLDASMDPGGAGQVISLANQIGTLAYDTSNGSAATQSLQQGVSTLQQVTNLLDQLATTASAAANGTTTAANRQSDASVAQSLLQQLVQLANTQGANGGYLFAGSKSNAPAFATLPSGQIVFNGDAGSNQIEIAPSLSVASTVSGQNVFMNVAAGTDGLAVTADANNTGSAYALAQGVTNASQVSAASLAGTQYDISFSGSGQSLTYQVTSGTGTPGTAGYNVTAGVVASGSFTAGSNISFDGIQVQLTGTPAAGDSFAVQPGATTTLFQTVQNFIAALGMSQNTGAQAAQAQQALQNVMASIKSSLTSVLSAQATLGSSLAEIKSVASQMNAQSDGAVTAMSNLQSANLPEVLANYSESLTALQAAEETFAKLQNLSLFQFLR